MKKLLILIIPFSFILSPVLAQQAPQKFNYQAIARDAGGKALAEQEVVLQISILSGDAADRPVYIEEHTVVTNRLGLFNLQIGAGEALEGSMESIDWGSAPHYVSLAMDAEGNGRFEEMGTSQLLSVPYALYAEKSGSAAFNEEGGSRNDPNDWTINGNAGTDENVNFIGTTDLQDLVVRTNGLEVARFTTEGNIELNPNASIKAGTQNILNAIGTRNIHIGRDAGAVSTGSQNSFIGSSAGSSNTTGYDNAFIGPGAGRDNTTGYRNVFIGFSTGRTNTTGYRNTFIGGQSGFSNTEGFGNSGIGFRTGYANTTGIRNTFIGDYAGQSNTTGYFNTYVGKEADGAPEIFNATAIGAGAYAAESNTVILGNGVNVGIGTSAPSAKLDVVGNIRMADGNQQDGYVMTSDANGNASWTPASSLSVTSVFDTLNGVVVPGGALDETSDDFVFGSTQLEDDGNTDHDNRFFFDKSKGAFRAGSATEDQWDDANAGQQSVAFGSNNIASGTFAASFGTGNTSSSTSSLAIGTNNTASSFSSVAIGDASTSSSTMAFSMGSENVSSGSYSLSFGQQNSSSNTFSVAIGRVDTASGFAAIAIGDGNLASGSNSTAIGIQNTASGIRSIAMGNVSVASATYATAIGNQNTASGISSIALGEGTVASGTQSTAMGYLTEASGIYSTAMGDRTEASGIQSVAMGSRTVASATQSFAMGSETTASGNVSTAIGTDNIASGYNSVALGNNTTAPSAYEMTVGVNSTEYTPTNIYGWAADDRLFTIGNGRFSFEESDALVILKSGETGIGTSTPDTTLHLVGKFKYQDDSQAAGYVLTSDANGNATWTNPLAAQIADADGDTKIQVEESTDEDRIRFDVAGTEALRMERNSNGDPMFDLNDDNTFINTTPSYNTGLNNTFVGNDAGSANTSGSHNAFFGSKAGLNATTASENTFIGHFSGNLTTSAYQNVFVGAQTGRFNTTGGGNVYLGTYAGLQNNGSRNVFIGYAVGHDSTGVSNRLIIEGEAEEVPLIYGQFDNDWLKINGHLSASLGFADADNDTKIQVEESADEDVIRFDAGGVQVGSVAANGKWNLATSSNNLLLGNGNNGAGGSGNTFIGNGAAAAHVTGNSNTAIGGSSMALHEDGQSNVSVGSLALNFNETGSSNTVLGYAAGYNNLGDANIFIGHRAGMNETGSNKLYIDNSNTSSPLIYGEFDSNLLAVNGTLRVNDGTQAAGSVLTSDASGNATWVAPVTSTYGEYVPGGTISVTSTSFSTTGMSVTLPEAGTYRLSYCVRLEFSNGTLMAVRLYNSTVGQVVANSGKHGPYSDDNTLFLAGDVAYECFVTVTEATTIELQARRTDTTNAVGIFTNSETTNKLTYMKVAG